MHDSNSVFVSLYINSGINWMNQDINIVQRNTLENFQMEDCDDYLFTTQDSSDTLDQTTANDAHAPNFETDMLDQTMQYALLPPKSADKYKSQYEKLIKFLNIGKELESIYKPTEKELCAYLMHLRDEGYKWSSMSSKIAMIATVYKNRFSAKLKNVCPNVFTMLDRFQSGYTRRVARHFSPENLIEFFKISLAYNDPFWVLRRCYVSIACCGGLRTAQCRSIKYGDVVATEHCYKVTYYPAKNRGEMIESKFLVPRNDRNTIASFSSYVDSYVTLLKRTCKNKLEKEQPFFLNATIHGIGTVPMGRNAMYDISI